MAGFGKGGMSWLVLILIVVVAVILAGFISPWLQGLFAKKT